jgi:hypothetical protein
MRKGMLSAALGVVLLGAPLGAAYAQGVPGSEIAGQAVQVETNGVVNTIYFDQGGAARIMSPSGNTVQGTWSAANGQLCLQTGTGQECWPYQSAFQAGQQVTLVSSCQVASRWTPSGVNPGQPSQSSAGERG